MFETHETRNGQEMMICRMSDEHLLNTIENMIEQATYTIKKLDKNIQPYIMEAALKGINVTELVSNYLIPARRLKLTEFDSLINDLKKLDYNPKEDY